ncbi:hypothetical protein [uncultured Alsobacter sp.]|uniref:hypothetical protein n=1 Tax=uncultured Alsobacter sp. TaxID=1748258 RepID=UPI0025E2E8B1|nr:hypothetical protein [uncultured Alsobacter sp.]
MPFAKGENVRVVTPVIEGFVVGARVDEEKLQLRYNVRWTDKDGNVVERDFLESDLELVKGPGNDAVSAAAAEAATTETTQAETPAGQ